MKSLFFTLSFVFLTVIYTYAQNGREVHGTIIDSTKATLPGSYIKLTSELKSDSIVTAANNDGKFVFASVKGKKITLTVTSIGYQSVRKHYALDNDTKPVILDPIVLQTEANQLKQVNITSVNPVTFKEDTIEYKAGAYKVRENAPIEDVIKKLPGVDVDVNGNVTAQGKQVTKVRVNGKDFFGGDVQTATKNLPADVVESIQMIDDYGDQANLTGVKTGEPDKIMNITIRKDKNYGYFGQATAGDGNDDIPAAAGSDQNRYLGTVKAFDFDGNRQIALLGVLNNTNANLFNFNSAGSPGGGGFGGGGFGGGRGNALRGGGQSSGLATTANGITNTRSIGTNYNDQWGKHIAAYGSYSFTDNTIFTNTSTLQNNNFQLPSSSKQMSQEHDNPINHRFNFSMEYKPDTINYLKVTPTFSYGSTNTTDFEDVSSTRGGIPNLAYTTNSIDNSSAPNFGLTALYNHRFNAKGRNFSANFTVSSSKNSAFDNPVYDYIFGVPTAPTFQVINTDSRTTSYGTSLSYMEPVGRVSYLELNYGFNHSYTASDKETDTATFEGNLNNYPLLSNNYHYTFTTNRVGLNFRYVEKKYNYTLGLGVEPATLDGQSLTNGAPPTHVTTFNITPTAHFVYNFSRSHSINVNFSSSSSQPNFNQLQPVVDFSNALYPVQGNPNLKPTLNNTLNIRFNNFSFESGNILFINAQFVQANNQVVNNTITYPDHFSNNVALTPELQKLQNTNLTTYSNANGYYSATGFVSFAKPWDQRKFTLMLNGAASYTNNIGYSSTVNEDDIQSASEKNIAKSLVLTPSARFRVDITDVVDAQASGSYSIAKTTNSQTDSLYQGNTNIRALTLALTGKNYFFKDWTLSYDYSKVYNYGYASTIKVTNPNILNLYVERRFLKGNAGAIRLSAFDIFNQNTGFSTTTNGSIVTQTNVNRLGRYYLASFTFYLKKFAGKTPTQDMPGSHGFRHEGGPGGGPGRPPGGGPE